MADFKNLATQYVLADKPSVERGLAKLAADAITTSAGNTTVVGQWAASINQWMAGSSDDDAMGTGGGDVIARAKALSFMADTLAQLPGTVLRPDQVTRLVAFFCSLFDIDHKAGISPATRSLKKLRDMKNFSPALSVRMMESACNLKDDFRLQTPTTRFEIYELLHSLLQQPLVRTELLSKHGLVPRLIVDLVSQCRNERDPKNLMEWFHMLKLLLQHFSTPPEVTQEIFGAFSPYFPISLRDSATDAGVTVPELKAALRECFAAEGKLSVLAFPFLIQKLDQGGINVGVKMDILETMQACVENYEGVQSNIVPFVDKLWGSLKYEVRNGEVEECINKTLEVFRSIAQRLAGTDEQPRADDLLEGFSKTVSGDCLDDLSNPTYTESAGRMILSVLGSSPGAYAIMTADLLNRIKENINQPKSPAHTRDLTSLLNRFLECRLALLNRAAADGTPKASHLAAASIDIADLLHQVYLPIWRQNMVSAPSKEQAAIVKEAMKGLALLIGQPGQDPGSDSPLACSPASCSEICKTLSYRIVNSLILSSVTEPPTKAGLEDEAVLALHKCAMAFSPGFSDIVSEALAAVSQCNWEQGIPKKQLDDLATLLKRLAFIGCSDIPGGNDPLGPFITLTGSLLQLLHRLLKQRSDFRAATAVLSGIYSAILNLQDACDQVFGPDSEAAKKLPLQETGEPITGAWWDEARDKYPWFPVIDQDIVVDAFADSQAKKSPTAAADQTLSNEQPGLVVQGFRRLSLYIVVQLYRRAVKATIPGQGAEPAGTALSEDFRIAADDISQQRPLDAAELRDMQDQYLHTLAGMATFVLRLLSEKEQGSLQLQQQPCLLWTLEDSASPRWSAYDSGRTNVLALGILRALWPGVMLETFKNGGISDGLLTDAAAVVRQLPDRTQEVRDAIATTMANKFSGSSPGPAASEPRTWNGILHYLQPYLEDKDAGRNLSLDEWSRVLSIVAGSIMRLDRSIAQIAPQIVAVPGADVPDADVRARMMETLVSPKEYLTSANHAVVRPLFNGWVYAHFVKPMIAQASPFQQELPRARHYALAVLHTLRPLPFNVYQDDVEAVTRILIVSLDALTAWADLKAAFAVLLAVLEHEPAALREHLHGVINGAVRAYKRALLGSGGERAAARTDVPRRLLRAGNPGPCRRDAVVLLGRLPGAGIEERHLLPFKPALERTLKDMSGDPVREVRTAALAAREAWSKLE